MAALCHTLPTKYSMKLPFYLSLFFILPFSLLSAPHPGHRLMLGYGEGLMELDKNNHTVWHYQDPEIELVHDVWKLDNVNIVFSHRYGVREVYAAKQTVWDFKARQ